MGSKVEGPFSQHRNLSCGPHPLLVYAPFSVMTSSSASVSSRWSSCNVLASNSPHAIRPKRVYREYALSCLNPYVSTHLQKFARAGQVYLHGFSDVKGLFLKRFDLLSACLLLVFFILGRAGHVCLPVTLRQHEPAQCHCVLLVKSCVGCLAVAGRFYNAKQLFWTHACSASVSFTFD